MSIEMKIMLIRPRWTVERQAINTPMGAMYIASSVREWVNPTPEVSIYHMEKEGAGLKDLRHHLEKEQPDVIGFSVLSAESPGLNLCMEVAREVLPDVFIAVGGPHATIFHDMVLRRPEVDAVVIGEGEKTFAELIDRLQSDMDWRDIDGIAYNDNGMPVYNSPREYIADIDEIPHPAYDLIDIPAYSGFHHMNSILAAWPFMTIFTSRACPYGCIYCHRIFGKRFRGRSPENVMEEIQLLYENYGVREIHITDDIFNWDKHRAKTICRKIIESKYKLKIAFPNGIRADLLDDELIELLAAAGTYTLNFAVETVSPRIQKITRKNVDLEKLDHSMQKAFDEGIIPQSFYMLGFPTETEEEIRKTIHHAVRSPALKASFFSVLPYPRTKLYDWVKENNPDFDVDDDKFKDMQYYTQGFYDMVRDDLDLTSLVKMAYKKFYLRPWRIMKIIQMYPKNRNFLRAMLYGLRLLWVGRFWEKARAKVVRLSSGFENIEPKHVPMEMQSNGVSKK